jgi:hypothetical protein
MLSASLLVRGIREGVGPGLLMLAMLVAGIAELSGTLSRRRWRTARQQIARRSTASSVRVRYEWQTVFFAVCLLLTAAFAGLLLSLNQTLGPWIGGALGLILILPFVYATLTFVVNTRTIACEGDKITCSTGPLPLRRSRHFSPTRVMVQLSPDSSLTVLARSNAGVASIVSLCSLELALCLADELNTRLVQANAAQQAVEADGRPSS